jgi:hypothetical protein
MRQESGNKGEVTMPYFKILPLIPTTSSLQTGKSCLSLTLLNPKLSTKNQLWMQHKYNSYLQKVKNK